MSGLGDAMSAVLAFYGGGVGVGGQTLAGILAMDDAQIEAAPDAIAALFPLPEATALHPAAALLTDEDIAAFHDRPDLHAALEKSLARLRAFYGLPAGKARQVVWLTPGNPHHARLSRILRSLHLLAWSTRRWRCCAISRRYIKPGRGR